MCSVKDFKNSVTVFQDTSLEILVTCNKAYFTVDFLSTPRTVAYIKFKLYMGAFH